MSRPAIDLADEINLSFQRQFVCYTQNRRISNRKDIEIIKEISIIKVRSLWLNPIESIDIVFRRID